MSIIKKIYKFFESMFRCKDEKERYMKDCNDKYPSVPYKLSTVVRVPGVPSIRLSFLEKDEGDLLKDDLMFDYEDVFVECSGFLIEVIDNEDVKSIYAAGGVDYETLVGVADVVRKKMLRVKDEGRMLYVDGDWCYMSPDFYFEMSKWGKN